MSKKYSSAVMSCLIWGSGQFFILKQRIKGLLLFSMQVLLVGTELLTGYWFNFFAGEIPNFEIRLYGGFFTKGIWGLVTLGTVPGVHGDHSTTLLVKGLIALFIILIFLGFFIWNIADAFRTGKEIDRTHVFGSREHGKRRYQKIFPYVVLLPVTFIMLFIVFMPIAFSVLTAFTNYDASHTPPVNLISWVGFQNFIKLLSVPIWSTTFVSVLIWTIIWTFCATFTSYFMGLFQALILSSRHVKHKSFFRSIYILPWAIPGMISLLVFRNLLNGQFGPLNQLLLDIGIISERIPFLTDPIFAKISIILVNLWMSWPVFLVMLTGILANQDPNLYEAAEIDGANKFQVFSRIKLPLLMNATAPLIVMNLAGNFNAFGTIYFLTEGKPTNASYQFAAGETDILISWIYKLTLQQRMYSMASVMTILLFIFIAVVSYWNFRRTKAFKEV